MRDLSADLREIHRAFNRRERGGKMQEERGGLV